MKKEKSNNVRNGLALSSVELLVAIEPGLSAPTSDNDFILITRMPNVRGEEGDVRDIVFERKAHNWQCGISAKNNNNFIKHSRLSNAKDNADFTTHIFNDYHKQLWH